MNNADRMRMNAGVKVDKNQKIDENSKDIIRVEEVKNRLSTEFLNLYRMIRSLRYTIAPSDTLSIGLYATRNDARQNPVLKAKLYKLAKIKLKNLEEIIEEELGENGHRDSKEREQE